MVKQNLLSFLISFILLSTMSVYAQDVEEAVFDEAVSTGLTQSSTNTFFDDPQPIYNSSWQWMHEQPNGNTLRQIKMWDANNWYAVGLGGTFMKTSDAGATWTVVKEANGLDNNGSNEAIYDFHWWNMSTGIIAGGYGTCYKTTDGGLTWDSLSSFPTAATCYDLYFVDDTLGFAGGTTSMRIYKTTDGGNNWIDINGDIPSTTVYQVYAVDENNIRLATSSGNFRYTTNGGINWLSVNVGGTGTLYDMVFTDAMNGWVSGSNDNPSYTTDGGLTWTQTTTSPTTSIQYDIDVVNNTVYVTGDAFNIYSTTDMGATWSPVSFLGAGQPWTGTYYSTDWIAADNFVTVGSFGLINEVNPTDATVAHTTFVKGGTLYSLWAESAGGRIIAGGSGTTTTAFDQAMYSTDGGATWAVSTMMDSSDLDFNDISMISPLIGYSAGEDGRVMKTTDGGASWFRVTDPYIGTLDLECIFFVDENTGYTFGTPDEGYKTTDGGTTWSVLTTGVTATLNRCFFTDANTGWVVGASGTVLKTTDGGATFTSQDPLFTSTIYSIWMVDANIGYLSGSSGTIRKTTDGGTTWTDIDPNLFTSDPALYDIEFKNADNGMTVGSTGRTYYTNDGGTTWSFENTGMSTIYAVAIEKSISDTSAAYVAGTNAYIMRNMDVILPVELSTFSASVSDNNVTLQWQTSTEINNSGFSVERRSVGANNWKDIAFVSGFGTSSEIHDYSYIDKNLAVGYYDYRLKQVDLDGSFKYYVLNESVQIGAPDNYSLEQNYPNPFNPTTKIKYSVPVNGLVKLSVYNILGEKIADIVNDIQQAGSYEITFDASNLSSGMYIYQMKVNDFKSVKKMMIMK
ncbi:MAG: YCF48-related protein [Ignavibacteriaceae bacterium]